MCGFPLIVAPQSSAIAFQREGVWWDRALVLTTAAAAASSSSSSQDEEGAIVMLKRHLRQQRTVEEYGRNIKQLAGRAQGLLSAGHPEGYVRAPPWAGTAVVGTRTPSGPAGRNGAGFHGNWRSLNYWLSLFHFILGLCQGGRQGSATVTAYIKVRVGVPR